MDDDLKKKLIEMAKRDERARSDLILKGELFNGYHPEMEKIHNENAYWLMNVINEHGLPNIKTVGDEAASATWIIIQHAIGLPDFQKLCLNLLKKELEKGTIVPAWVAYLEDRINVFEGKEQIYGTQFDWDTDGQLSPNPIADNKNVEALRKSIGLPPLEKTIEEIRQRAKQEGNKPPHDIEERKIDFIKWAKKVGWRK